MLVVCLLYITHLASGRLVLSSWSDLYLEDGSVDTERLAREADLLTVTSEPDPSCPGVELEVAEYEVVVAGEEVQSKVKTRKDIWNLTKTIANAEKPWVQGTVVLR